MVTDYVVKTTPQLGALLRGYRKERGLTQQQIGAKAAVPQPSISQMEADPGVTALARILKVLAALNLELVVREKRRTQEQPDW